MVVAVNNHRTIDHHQYYRIAQDMEPDFWHARWLAKQLGFHQDRVNADLTRYWHTLDLGSGRILVPLCGKSMDMHWLWRQGYQVAGIEISPLAVAAFFTESGLHPVRSEHPHYSRWSVAGIDLFCGDFFRLDQDDIGLVQGFYDRAALVALPHSRRGAYVEHLASLLPRQTRGLLITLDYEQGVMDGPPFAVSAGEVEGLFQPHFRIEQLLDADRLDAFPGFRQRGLQRLREQVFGMERR